MEQMNLNYDFRDIFKSPRLALSGKKIWIFVFANFLSYLIYFIINYLGLSLSGYTLIEIWKTQGLYPCLLIMGGPWYALVLFWTSILFWIYAIQLASTAVSRITYKQLKGDEFYSINDSWNFVKKHWHPLIFTSASLGLITLFFILLSVFLALLGKIPFVGELIFSLPYILYLFGSIFTIYTGLVFIISFIYSPSIVGTLEEDTMGSVFNNYAITWGQPWRIIAYHFILIPLACFSVGIYKLVSFFAIKLINIVMGHEMLMGSKLTGIFGVASNIVWPKKLFSSIAENFTTCSLFCDSTCNMGMHLNAFFDFFIPINSTNISSLENVAAIVIAFFLIIISISFLSYFLSIFSVGETIMFIIFRSKSGDDNILLHKDEDEFDAE